MTRGVPRPEQPGRPEHGTPGHPGERTRGTLQVLGLGHVNLFAPAYEPVRDFHARVFGAPTLREWEDPAGGGRNALWSLAGTDVELFTPLTPDGAIGRWVARHGGGWHSANWVVPSLTDALRTVAGRGIRVTQHVEGAYAFLHPRDCRGLTISLSEHSTAEGSAAGHASAGEPGPANPLGLLGGAVLCVASRAPDEAAAWLADLVGSVGPVRTEDRPHGGLRAAGVSLGDHVVEFVGPLPGAGAGPLATFLAEAGERFHSLGLFVADLPAARAALTRGGVEFEVAAEQGRPGSSVLAPGGPGAPVELRGGP